MHDVPGLVLRDHINQMWKHRLAVILALKRQKQLGQNPRVILSYI